MINANQSDINCPKCGRVNLFTQKYIRAGSSRYFSSNPELNKFEIFSNKRKTEVVATQEYILCKCMCGYSWGIKCFSDD